MQFFYPEYFDEFDFSEVSFLDQELLQLFPESASSARYVDETFPERMFRYYYRILDRYHMPVESLGILTDPRPLFMPQTYVIPIFRTRLQFDPLFDQQLLAIQQVESNMGIIE